MTKLIRSYSKLNSYKIPTRTFDVPKDINGNPKRVSEYYGENVFHFQNSDMLSKKDKEDLSKVIHSRAPISDDLAEKFANAVLSWATSKGATHFTHWFQPLTGSTAEKHDAFISIENGRPIEKLSASQLIQGEPDASSFPNGGNRSTFEARGYTSWDLSSPIFLKNSENGKTLCIPTAFVSYLGEALDIKTPLLRSNQALNEAMTNFLNIASGEKREESKVQHVTITAGCEQEYFLVDKSLYFERPDLVMGGRTLFGAVTSRNQQLEDHYFGIIPERILAYMQEVEMELYKLGIPAKTRHNEVAPGQFELAPIFEKANIAVDQNQLTMDTLSRVAHKHGFVCLLHEKPFAGINGSGKHLNWSMSDDKGRNLLDPTDSPQTNYTFLATVSMIMEAINRHAGLLRAAIASHSNDHRLGANEAPPSIISIFLGDTLTAIYEAIEKGEDFKDSADKILDLKALQVALLKKDNTDRNRTSPFAFTGNKFEFRALGSSANVGLPLSILNAAVADVVLDANEELKSMIAGGKSNEEALKELTKNYYVKAKRVVFNGDGYSNEWQIEAEKRGLPNLKTAADAYALFESEEQCAFLSRTKVLSTNERIMRFNVLVERYVKHREIEFKTLISMINRDVISATIEYKNMLANAISRQKEVGVEPSVDLETLKVINSTLSSMVQKRDQLNKGLEELGGDEGLDAAKKIAYELLPLSEEIAQDIAFLEENVAEDLWPIPTYFDMLFIK